VFEESVVDLIILDIMMPGPDGFEVCRTIRRQSGVPIIMLSARGQEKDIVRALDLGADDYLTKPFGVEEMLARVRAALRRTPQTGVASRPPLVVEDLEIDFAARCVAVHGREVQLTPTEYNLLVHLAINAGRVITHQALLQAVWGPEYSDETEYVWVYIRRLRCKIEPDPGNPRYILTQPGVGYCFVAPP
jgi:DNA-binding response OmpR family regulator